jgi:WD40 repeat protein/serine/threonine protein kinase
MSQPVPCNEDLVRRLPLPLAQLYRRAHNAKTALERHQAAFYLGEATLKLLSAVAVVEFAERADPDPQLAERLQNLARPSLGHWWEFVRLLVPVLADAGDPGFQAVRDLVLGKSRDNLPRTAGLDAALCEVFDGRAGARSTVRLSELLDRLVRYRNREVGHGAAGHRPAAFYEQMGRALLAGLGEILGQLDVLAGRRLLYVEDVRRQASGRWLVERYELIGETARRIESLDVAESEAARHLVPGQVYLEAPTGPRPLHPLAVYDAEAGELLFLSARRGRERAEYLGYTSGGAAQRQDLAGEQRALLARVLNTPVGDAQAAGWAARSQAEEAAGPLDGPASAAAHRLGEFELLSELGRGGMGVVYRAWQPSLGRQVALKCLLQAGDPKAEARFAREIRALGRVEHPHLVKVFTSGSEGDRWFYAMELVEGATLAAVCEKLTSRSKSAADVDLKTWHEVLNTVCDEARQAEKPLSDLPADASFSPTRAPDRHPLGEGRTPKTASRGYVRHVVGLVRQVAEAAHALHEKGILHRDIKPGNVLVGGDGDEAVLMDLGLAQLADDVQGRLTRTRQFVGTLRYASPEQVLAVGGLDRRSDAYGLGATLWELLALRPLYGAGEGTPEVELMRRIQFNEPGRLRKVHPGLPKDLDAVVSKCLEKDPGRRYATAQELADELGRFLAGDPVQARPVSEAERAWRWCRRNKAVASLVAAVACALVLGTVVASWLAVRADAQARRAQKSEQIALEAEKEAEAARARAVDDQRRAEKQRDRAEWLAYAGQIALAQREWQDGNLTHARELLDASRVDFRHFEYRYLYSLFNKGQRTLVGHRDLVECVAFSPDGKRLASGGRGHEGYDAQDRPLPGELKVWDAVSGQEVLSLKGHIGGVESVAFSPDGKRLASAGSYFDGRIGRQDRRMPGEVKVWDAVSGEVVLSLKRRTGYVTAVAFSPDGERLAGVGQRHSPGELTVWDTGTGQEILSLKTEHTRSSFTGVAFSPDGKRLASVSNGYDTRNGLLGEVKVWDAGSGQEVLTLKGHTEWFTGVTFSPDGKLLASADRNGMVKVWEASSGKEKLTFKGDNGEVRSVTFSPDGKRLAGGVGGHDREGRRLPGNVKVWDAGNGQEVLSLKGHDEQVTSVAFSPDGQHLASGSYDRTVKVWETSREQKELTFKGHYGYVQSVAFSPDGKRVASASSGGAAYSPGTMKVWEATSGQEVLAKVGKEGKERVPARKPSGSFVFEYFHSVAFSPDGKRLASAGRYYDYDTAQREGMQYRPPAGEVKVWDAGSGKEILTLKGHTGAVVSVTFSPDGQRLASASAGGQFDKPGDVKVWDSGSGKELLSLKGHTAALNSVAFSPDGQRLASADGRYDWQKERWLSGELKVWDAFSGQELLTLMGHASAFTSVAFSPDGTRLASASTDGTVKVWDVVSGQEVLTLKGHTGAVNSVAFSPDGKRLASGGGGDSKPGEVKVWEAAGGQEVLTLPGHNSSVYSVAFSPDGKRLASSCWSEVKVWDSGSGQ